MILYFHKGEKRDLKKQEKAFFLKNFRTVSINLNRIVGIDAILYLS